MGEPLKKKTFAASIRLRSPEMLENRGGTVLKARNREQAGKKKKGGSQI